MCLSSPLKIIRFVLDTPNKTVGATRPSSMARPVAFALAWRLQCHIFLQHQHCRIFRDGTASEGFLASRYIAVFSRPEGVSERRRRAEFRNRRLPS